MKNKILFILHFPPPIHGSAMVGNYIKESEIINQEFNCRYINLGTSRTVDEIGKNPLLKVTRYLSIVKQVLAQLIRFKPQLCYVAITAKGAAFYKDSFITFLIKMFGVQLIYHFHNKGISTRQYKALDNFLYRRVFKNSHAIMLSKYLYPDIQKYVPENRVYYCLNGIPEIFIREKIQNSRYRVEILFLSNLIESKGVFVLLEVCKILHEKNVQFHCTFVGGEGDITTEQFQQNVQKLGLETHVIYAGKKYGEEKESVLLEADIFVHPTFNDCLPLVIMEAMQFGLPVVSTYEGGIPDLVDNGETGFLVQQKDAAALAEKLEILILDAELREKMGAAGRKKYEEEFTLEKFENRFTEILTNITNRGK